MKTPAGRIVATGLASVMMLGLVSTPTSADPPPPHNEGWEQRLEQHTQGVLGAVAVTQDGMWDRSNTSITSRSLASVVAAELREDRDPVAAWEALEIILDHQNMDPSAHNYGQFVSQIWAGCYYGLQCLNLEVPYYTRTEPGSYAQFSQTVDVSEGEHVLEWAQRRSFPYGSGGYHLLQVLVDGTVVWQEQANSGDQSWETLSVDLTAQLQGKSRATIAVRLYEQRAVAQLPIKISFDNFALSNTNLNGDVKSEGVWDLETGGIGVSVGLQANSSSDINATSFTSLMLAGIMNSDDIDLLTPEQQTLLKERTRIASWNTVDEPHAQIGYTNARLIRDVHMILVGQATGDEELYQLGLANYRDWLAYTRQWGIREYNSPVYYGIDLGALMMAHNYLADDTVRAEFAWALDLFWWDMAANYFPARESLSGSHSRDYDFVRGTGPSAYFLSIEGWQNPDKPLNAGYTTFNYQAMQSYWGEHIYHPHPAHTALAFKPEKEVEAITDPDRNLDRYNYVSSNWALGSTSESFTNVIPGAGGTTPYDKPFNLELGGGRELGQITLVPSWNTDPYGIDYPGSAPLHAPLFPTTAQHKGAVLTELDLNPAGQRVPAYYTSVLIPGDADLVLLDGEPVDTQVLGETVGSTTSTLTVMAGGACGVVRVLGAAGVEGQTPTASLVVDGAGLEQRMARFTISQFESETPVRLTTDSAPVGFYLQAADCATEQDARDLTAAVAAAPVVHSTEGDVRRIQLTAVDGTLLDIGTDTVLRDPAHRLVNGEPMVATDILTVNGAPVYKRALPESGKAPLPKRPWDN
ncbi:hypothetical protein GCM10028820_04130 [Tessaracoccus terricola]